jgi:beta-galactosidase/beta-glucuronidase
VEVVRTANGYQLLRGGVPYTVRGAGMEVDDLAGFAASGGNSIRNWTTEDHSWRVQALLDEAHAHGVTVALCLAMKPERAGFDSDDPRAVARQFQRLRRHVIRYRDHPALLFWIVGNELNDSYTNPRVYDAVSDVARMVRELDPNHPTTTTIAGFSREIVEEVTARATPLDFISFQLYGKLFTLPGLVREADFDRPFMVTEWGTIGYWEVEPESRSRKVRGDYEPPIAAVDG